MRFKITKTLICAIGVSLMLPGFSAVAHAGDIVEDAKVLSIAEYEDKQTKDETVKGKKYLITYRLDGGDNHDDNPSYYTKKTADITLKKPHKEGYKFKGWYSDKKFKKQVKIIKNGSTGDKTLYAKWQAEKYSIKYKLDGGKNNSKNPSVYTIEKKVTLKEPTKAGYNFAGWYTDKKLTQKIKTIKKGSQGDITLYAKWVESSTGIIKNVKVPDDYISVCDYGAVPNDGKDDTEAFQETLCFAAVFAENGYKSSTVYVPEGVYNVKATDPYSKDTGISVRSNTKLIMDNNAILSVKGNSKQNYAVIKALKANNFTIQGGKIQGERYSHTGKKGESGHGFSILGCKNVTISDMFIASNWGDGIYLGTWRDGATGKLTGNKNIKIRRCEITDNRRNNISIIDADDVTIDKCNISDAHGTAPQCGICIEPNKGSTSGDQICSDITIKNTTISAYRNKNAMNWWCFMTTAYGSQSTQPSSWVTAKNIKFENCTFNGYVANYSGNNLKVDKKTKFNGTFVSWRSWKKIK